MLDNFAKNAIYASEAHLLRSTSCSPTFPEALKRLRNASKSYLGLIPREFNKMAKNLNK